LQSYERVYIDLNTNNWKQVLGESILIPRRSQEERQKTRLDSIKRILSKTHIDGDLDLDNTLITNLGNLTSVGGYLWLSDTPITNLGNLTSVGGYFSLFNTPITNLGNLTSVGRSLDLYKTPITNLGNLTSVGGNLWLSHTPISKMNELQRQEVLKNVKVKGSIIYEYQ
jgi:hypothetical protein